MKKILLIFAAVACCFNAQAYTNRNLITSKATREEIKEMLVTDQQWVTLPAYSDRAGWDALLGDMKDFYIKRGERALRHNWPRVKATDYLEYERSGNRRVMEDPIGANNNAVADLLLAELAEGKGRFIDQLINGVYAAAEMTSWALSAHNVVQPSHRSIQAYDFPVLDLVSCDMGNLYSWVYYFMHQEFDKIDPEISRRLRHEIKTRVLDPYLTVDTWWWDGSRKYNEGRMLNNWTPWCLSNILLTSMLMEEDPERYAETAYLTMEGVDKFLNYIKGDGACEEGPSYWEHAAGKTLDYIDMLKMATGGKIDMSDSQLIRDMGEYIARSYVGDGWVVNFADASARGGADPYLAYRYGKAMDSDILRSFASLMNNGKKPENGRDMFRTLQSLSIAGELNSESKEIPRQAVTWYPETEFCYLTTPEGIFFASKGGYNDESHNHNDVGSFSLWADNFPIIIDAGVGTYTRQTFSSERYNIWSMQSGWHNLPVINGVEQRNGRRFKASDAKASKGHFEVNIANAYPPEAKVREWKRNYDLKKRELKITDNFTLEEAIAPNVINFLTWGDIDISIPGKIIISVKGHEAQLSYDPAEFVATVTEQPLPDSRLSNVWGSKISRISLTAKKTTTKGSYKYSVKVL